MAIYQARFNRYLEDRGLKPRDRREGVGVSRRRRDRRARSARRHHAGVAREARQPDLRHQLQPAAARRPGARQRPDHPGARSDLPRRRLERRSRCSGARSGTICSRRIREGLLVKRMGEVVDGEYQKYAVESGAYVRKHFWGADPRLLEMVKHLSDEQLKKLTLGGHDPDKVYNAYKRAVETKGMPDRRPGPHHQGLRRRRVGRRQERHPPAEEAERRRGEGVPHALRHSDLR